MPTPDILTLNPRAAFHHSKAQAYLNSEPDIARGHLWSALAAIEDNVRTDPGRADTAYQLATIRQDEARTYVSEAMLPTRTPTPPEKIDKFRRAYTALQGHALDQTSPFVSGQRDPRFRQSPSSPLDPLYEARMGRLFSTHAKTLSMIARIATAQEVVLQEMTEDTQIKRALYHPAYYYALMGDDATTLTSIAMFAARDARLSDDEQGKEMVDMWASRARSSLWWAVRNDPSNVISSWKIYRQGRFALKSVEAAADAVLAGA